MRHNLNSKCSIAYKVMGDIFEYQERCPCSMKARVEKTEDVYPFILEYYGEIKFKKKWTECPITELRCNNCILQSALRLAKKQNLEKKIIRNIAFACKLVYRRYYVYKAIQQERKWNSLIYWLRLWFHSKLCNSTKPKKKSCNNKETNIIGKTSMKKLLIALFVFLTYGLLIIWIINLYFDLNSKNIRLETQEILTEYYMKQMTIMQEKSLKRTIDTDSFVDWGEYDEYR